MAQSLVLQRRQNTFSSIHSVVTPPLSVCLSCTLHWKWMDVCTWDDPLQSLSLHTVTDRWMGVFRQVFQDTLAVERQAPPSFPPSLPPPIQTSPIHHTTPPSLPYPYPDFTYLCSSYHTTPHPTSIHPTPTASPLTFYTIFCLSLLLPYHHPPPPPLTPILYPDFPQPTIPTSASLSSYHTTPSPTFTPLTYYTNLCLSLLLPYHPHLHPPHPPPPLP